MNNSVPAVGLGHFVMKVRDIDISYQFIKNWACGHFSVKMMNSHLHLTLAILASAAALL
jgi:hypothetical protein